MAVALARAPSMEDMMMVDWQPSQPAATSPERKRRRVESYTPSPSYTWRQPVLPTTRPPPTSPASSLPDELMISIISLVGTTSSPRGLAAAARVCKRWLPAATHLLYTSLAITSAEPKLARTLWNGPRLRTLVRSLSIRLFFTFTPADAVNLLGWIRVLPAGPGLRTLEVHVDFPDAAVALADILATSPACRAVARLAVHGSVPLLPAFPLETLALHGVQLTRPAVQALVLRAAPALVRLDVHDVLQSPALAALLPHLVALRHLAIHGQYAAAKTPLDDALAALPRLETLRVPLAFVSARLFDVLPPSVEELHLPGGGAPPAGVDVLARRKAQGELRLGVLRLSGELAPETMSLLADAGVAVELH